MSCHAACGGGARATLPVARTQFRMSPFHIEHFALLDSTNQRLLRRAATEDCHRCCVVADSQSAGRGQRGRAWHAAPGTALLFSVAWRFAPGVALDGLSLAVGAMTVAVLAEQGVLGLRLKWPNDLLAPLGHGGTGDDVAALGKLGGVLIETVSAGAAGRTAVIGVGINVSAVPTARLRPDALPPVCLDDLVRQPLSRERLLEALIERYARDLPSFADQGFAPFRDAWWQARAWAGQPLDVRLPDGRELSGGMVGLAPGGALVIEAAGALHTLVSGEVSVRAARS